MLETLARIRHRRTRRQLSPYLDGMLSARESRRLEAHLARCRACRDELAELQATVQALAELPLAEAPRSFALTAAPRRIEAARPAARRLEFGLGAATAAVAFVLALVAAGDLLGVADRGEDAGDSALRALQMERQPAPTESGAYYSAPDATRQSQADQLLAPEKAMTGAPTPPPAGAGDAGQEAGSPSAVPSEGVPETQAPSVEGPPVVTEAPLPAEETSTAEPTLAATATPGATAAPASGEPPATATPASPPATGPGPATPEATQTPEPAEGRSFTFEPTATAESVSPAAPNIAAATAAATPTPPPAGAALTPSEPEGQPPAAAESQPLAADESGPSRETVVRWLEIGLAGGLALLFVSWVLARRRGWA